MNKVFQYSFLDLIRNRWSIIYAVFFALSTGGLIYLSGDSAKVLVSLMNVVILLVPLVSLLYGMMYMYQVREYVEILLAQPISRKQIFRGYYFGLSSALSIAVAIGILLPIAVFRPGALLDSSAWWILIFISVVLTFIFSGLACWISIRSENKLKGFGIGIFIWLFTAVLYDGLVLILLIAFESYPIEKLALGLTLSNPIDMGRVFLIFQLDYSALMGYTGAVFEKFFGTKTGAAIIVAAYALWIVTPVWMLLRSARKKDF